MDHAVALRTSSASISAGVGIAVLHMSRVATIAPATFPRSTASRAGIPRTRPAAKAAVRASPAPIPHRTSTAMPGRSRRPASSIRETPAGPCLRTIDRRPAAGRDDRDEAGRGELVVAPDQHVAQPGRLRREARRLARVDPQARPPVEVEDRRRRGSPPARGPSLVEDPEGRGPGRLLGQQRRRHDRQRGRGEQPGRHVVEGQACLGRGPRPVEGDREAVRRPDLEERDLRPRAGHGRRSGRRRSPPRTGTSARGRRGRRRRRRTRPRSGCRAGPARCRCCRRTRRPPERTRPPPPASCGASPG